MIIVMSPNATKENLDKVIHKVESAGLKVHVSTGEEVTIVGVIGDKKKIAGLEMNMKRTGILYMLFRPSSLMES